MRTKKPRSRKAVKSAARTVRRATLSKPRTLRRKPSPANSKGAKRTTPKKPKRVLKRKTRAAVKTKTVRKRIIRKPKARALPIPIASEQPVPPVVAATEQGSEAVPLEQAEVSMIPGEALTGRETAQTEADLPIPQILLEGDEPFSPSMTGPGQKYALGPTPPAGQSVSDEAALPEAYGTGKLL